MGSCNSQEPAERIVFTWPEMFSGWTCHETEEKDPVIESCMPDVTLYKGEGQTFVVSYKAFSGPVTITLSRQEKGGTTMLKEKSKLIRQGKFEFRLKADLSSTGTYIVEVLDQGRRQEFGNNPVGVSCDITVVKK